MLTHHSQLEGVKEGHQGDKRPRACQNKMHLTARHAIFRVILRDKTTIVLTVGNGSILCVTDTFELLKAVAG